MATISSSDPMQQAAESIERLRRGAVGGAADYLTAALARLRAAADVQGFEVGEVTLRFDQDAGEVRIGVGLRIAVELLDHTPAEAVTPAIPAPEKARRYRHKLVDLLEKAEAVRRSGAGKAELAALADEAHTVRTQLDVEERVEARRQTAPAHSGAIGAPRDEEES